MLIVVSKNFVFLFHHFRFLTKILEPIRAYIYVPVSFLLVTFIFYLLLPDNCLRIIWTICSSELLQVLTVSSRNEVLLWANLALEAAFSFPFSTMCIRPQFITQINALSWCLCFSSWTPLRLNNIWQDTGWCWKGGCLPWFMCNGLHFLSWLC